MKKTFLLFVFCSPLFSSGQQTELDSLYSIWETKNQSDSIIADAMYNYLILYRNGDYNKQRAMSLCQNLLDYSDSVQSNYGLAVGNSMMAAIYYSKRDYDSAKALRRKALKYSRKAGYKVGVARQLGAIANLDIERVLELDSSKIKLMECIALWTELGNQKEVLTARKNLGLYYHYKGDLKNAVIISRENSDLALELELFYDVVDINAQLGLLLSRAGEFALAEKYLKIATDHVEQVDSEMAKFRLYSCWGTFLRLQGRIDELKKNNQLMTQLELYRSNAPIGAVIDANRASRMVYQNKADSAIAIFERIRPIFLAFEFLPGVASCDLYLGKSYLFKKENQKAISYCLNSYELSSQTGVPEDKRDACECLAEGYKAVGNYEQSLLFYSKFEHLKDSLIENGTKGILAYEFKREAMEDSIAKAEEARLISEAHQTEMRQEAKTRNWSIALGTLALLLAGGFYSRWRYVRKSRDLISQERDRSENLLLNILPEEIAQELKEKGKADARDFEMVSILFTDFKGFTEQSAKLSAADLVNEINHCFEAFDGIMEKYRIEKIKTIGDAYMAAGGLPVPTDDSVKNTVLAALEMQEFIVQRHQTKVQSGEAAFEMRVGIHTGPVVAGIVGVKKFQYDIWGDTVNTASRMESSGYVGKVNISQATYELLKDDAQFQFDNRGRIEAKGKGEMEMYFVSLNS